MQIFLFATLFFHLAAALFSEGFHHFDEHYQILEFVGYKLGTTPASSLPWEFSAQMRPWLWPSIYYPLAKLLPLGPFALATLFRFISTLLGLLSIALFALVIEKETKDPWTKKFQYLFLTLLWFLPYLHARISAETLGGSLLSIGVATYLLKKERTPYFFLVGFIVGLASISRYHIALLAIIFFLWMMIIEREKFKNLSLYALGGILATLLSVMIDYWGYGTITFAPYTYFMENILHNKAAAFGVAPWWDYLRLLFKKGPFFIAIPILVILFYHWIKKPKSLYTWLTTSFIILHSLVSHKELRFLFPLVTFIPMMISEEFTGIFKERAKKIIFNALLILNIPLMIYTSFTPAHDVVGFFKNYKEYNIANVAIVGDLDPFAVASVPMHFYVGEPPKLIHLESSSALNGSHEWVFVSRLPEWQNLKAMNCTMKFANYSNSVLEWAFEYNITKRMRLYALFNCPTLSAR